MQTQQVQTEAARSTRLPFAFVITAVLIGFAVSGGAFAATSLKSDCAGKQSIKQSLMTPPAPSQVLSVIVVDLTNTDSGVGLQRPLESAESEDESLAPLLYLAPRVASILDDVFQADDDATATDAEIQQTVAPMAERSDDPAPVATDAEDTLEVQPALMRIQRQMYRTDI